MQRKKQQQSSHIYWEKQQKLLCAIHATNALLQGPYCNFEDFRKIAMQLDRDVKNLMEQDLSKPTNQMNIGDLDLQQENSDHWKNDGMFSIEVIKRFLSKWGLQCDDHTSQKVKEMGAIMQIPFCFYNIICSHIAQGFICHSANHWFCIRKIDGRWYNLNSTNKHGPEKIGKTYFGQTHPTPFFLTLYSVCFLIKSQISDTEFSSSMEGNTHSLNQIRRRHLIHHFFQILKQNAANSFAKWYTPIQLKFLDDKQRKKKNWQPNIGQQRQKFEGEESSDSDWNLEQMTHIAYSGQGISLQPNWNCSKCTLSNKPQAKKCQICGEPKGGSKALTGPWECPFCTIRNPARSNKCSMCQNQRPENIQSVSDIQLQKVMQQSLKQKFLVKPQKTQGMLTVNFRVQGGKTINWNFQEMGTLKDLYDFVGVNWKGGNFQLRSNYPRKMYGNNSNLIKNSGIQDNMLLIVEKI